MHDQEKIDSRKRKIKITYLSEMKKAKSTPVWDHIDLHWVQDIV